MYSHKRLCSDTGENEGLDEVGFQSWDGLNPEILALIFVRIPADQMVRSVPLVCRSWLAAVAGPYCWTDIDLEQWCRRCNRPYLIDSAVRKLVRHSKCTFQRLCAYKLGNGGFSFVANCGRCLKVLIIPMSEVTDQMVERHAESLANLTLLDISNCLKITCKGLEAFGKQCKSLIHLKRNMPPPLEAPKQAVASKVDDSEATIIADTMTGLHHLELIFGRFGDRGLDAILNKCNALTHLDIQGCWSVELNGNLEDKCEQLVVFKSPWIDDYYSGGSSESDDNEADASEEASFFNSD